MIIDQCDIRENKERLLVSCVFFRQRIYIQIPKERKRLLALRVPRARDDDASGAGNAGSWATKGDISVSNPLSKKYINLRPAVTTALSPAGLNRRVRRRSRGSRRST